MENDQGPERDRVQLKPTYMRPIIESLALSTTVDPSVRSAARWALVSIDDLARRLQAATGALETVGGILRARLLEVDCAADMPTAANGTVEDVARLVLQRLDEEISDLEARIEDALQSKEVQEVDRLRRQITLMQQSARSNYLERNDLRAKLNECRREKRAMQACRDDDAAKIRQLEERVDKLEMDIESLTDQ